MTFNLKNKTINNVIWSAYERIGNQLITFIISVILARQLSPKVFGLIAMLQIFLAIGQQFVDSGFGSALIQRKDITKEHSSSVFYFNILLGIIIVVTLWFSAPLIADFFKQKNLILITRVLSLKFIVLPFGLVQMNLLMKELEFKTITKVNILSASLSGVIGIILAFLGYGVWSLVFKMISRDFFASMLLWIFYSWRPTKRFSLKAINELFVFGSRMFLSGLLNVIFTNIYEIVIGRFFSPSILGYYTRAKTLQDLPTKNISIIVSRVTFSSFSKIQNDYIRLKRGIKKVINYIMYINVPMMIGLAIVARPLVILLLTEKWLPIVPVLQVLCLTGILYPLHVMNLNLLKSIGRSDLFFRLGLLKRSITIISIIIAYRWGIMSLVWSQLIVSVICYFLNSYFTGKFINYSSIDQIRDVFPYFLQGALMGIIVYSIGFIEFSNNFVLLLVQVMTGMIVYFIFSYIFRLSVFFELLDLFVEQIHFMDNFKNKYFAWREQSG